MTDGDEGLSIMPLTPFSRTPRAIAASFASETAAIIISDCAARFSSGITFQSVVLTTT